MRELLVDGDVLVYMFAHRAQETIRWNRDLYVQHARMDRARVELADFVATLVKDLEADSVRIALSDLDSNFRKRLFSGYKGNRAGVVRPMLFTPIREWLMEEYGAAWFRHLEGDDVLGIWATEPGAQGDDMSADERIVCTIDKDLRTVPGLLHNWDRDDGIEEIDEYAAALYHMTQTLTGDRTDGYPGCPSVGPVKCDKLLLPLEDAYRDHGLARWKLEAWEVTVAAYEKAGLSEDVALMNARCAYILQAGDYGVTDNKVRPWTPDGRSE